MYSMENRIPMYINEFYGKLNSTEFMESKFIVEFGLPVVDEFAISAN